MEPSWAPAGLCLVPKVGVVGVGVPCWPAWLVQVVAGAVQQLVLLTHPPHLQASA